MMEYFSELLTTGDGYLEAVIAFLSAAVTWLVARFAWWKAQSGQLKVLVGVAVFLGVAIMLSLIVSMLN